MVKRRNSDEGGGNGTSGSKKAKKAPQICNACANERSPTCQFPSLPPTRFCSHAPQTCGVCVRKWIDSQVEHHGPLHIRCPDCPAIFTGADVTFSAFKATADKVYRFRRRAELEKLPGLVWCLNPPCDSGQVHLGGDEDPRFDCDKCHYSACIDCKVRWHTNETCSQFRARRVSPGPDEYASELAVARESKPCPNTQCKRPITKIAGSCDLITCSVCQTKFCWSCLVRYIAPAAKAHEPACKHFVKPDWWANREQNIVMSLERRGAENLESFFAVLRSVLAITENNRGNNDRYVKIQGDLTRAGHAFLRNLHHLHNKALDKNSRVELVSLREAIERYFGPQRIARSIERHLERRRAAQADGE